MRVMFVFHSWPIANSMVIIAPIIISADIVATTIANCYYYESYHSITIIVVITGITVAIVI